MLVEEIPVHQQTLAKQQPDPDTTGVFPRMCRELQLMQKGFGVLSTGGVVKTSLQKTLDNIIILKGLQYNG